ncbi:hypothetical protein GCM10010440_25100 [Kitasatospora cinereorecta]
MAAHLASARSDGTPFERKPAAPAPHAVARGPGPGGAGAAGVTDRQAAVRSSRTGR